MHHANGKGKQQALSCDIFKKMLKEGAKDMYENLQRSKEAFNNLSCLICKVKMLFQYAAPHLR